MAMEGPSFLPFSISTLSATTSTSITFGLVLHQRWFLLHEVMSLGIIVCVTLILKTFEYVHLIPLFLTGAWIVCFSTGPCLGTMTGCPSKLVSIGFEFSLGGFYKSHRSFPSHIPLSILFPAHPSCYLGLGTGLIIQGLYLILWEEWAKGLGGKSS
jgi:hypothetical protein